MKPPRVQTGAQVLDPADLRKIEQVRGNRQEITRLAKEVGSKLGMPDADHFFVPYDPDTKEPMRDLAGQLRAWVAKVVKP